MPNDNKILFIYLFIFIKVAYQPFHSGIFKAIDKQFSWHHNFYFISPLTIAGQLDRLDV
jgi:hypothetical protein